MCAFGWQKYGEFFNPPNFLHYFFNIYSSLPNSFTSHLIISYLLPFPSTLLSFTHIPSCESSLALPFTFYLLPFLSTSLSFTHIPSCEPSLALPFTFYLLSFTFYLLPFPPTIPKHNLSTLPLLCINLVTYVALPLYRGSLFYL